MHVLAGTDTNMPQKQRLAVCFSTWRNMHEDFTGIFNSFLQFFGEKEGPELYNSFVKSNGLDETKPNNPKDQLKESFEWTEPRIKYWKKMEDAKYYKMFLLAANVSMNKNDYTDKEDMKYASSNLAWRPLDIDHNDSWVLPFPNNRLETAFFDQQKNIIEAVIRISDDAKTVDTNESVQQLIEKGEIVHPSIYALPVCGIHYDPEGHTVPTCGYEFQRVALLRKSKSLPGDPLSKIFPLPLNESMAKSLVESLNGQKKVSESVRAEEQESRKLGDLIEMMSRAEFIEHFRACNKCLKENIKLKESMTELLDKNKRSRNAVDTLINYLKEKHGETFTVTGI